MMIDEENAVEMTATQTKDIHMGSVMGHQVIGEGTILTVGELLITLPVGCIVTIEGDFQDIV